MEFKKSFQEMCSRSYAFDWDLFRNSPDWNNAEKLFYSNYKTAETETKIPKIIHQVWIGGELPEKYKVFAESWKKFHPDWQYILWDDEKIATLPKKRQYIFDKATSAGMKSDIVRYEILRQHGGLYVDTDFECLKPFDDLMGLEFFTGISYDSSFQAYIGLIASIPNHPIMNCCINTMNTAYAGNKGSIIMNVTGANHFTKAFNACSKGSKNIVAFPTEFFYPFPNNKRNLEDPYKYVTENSYAIHHWAVSWVKQNQHV